MLLDLVVSVGIQELALGTVIISISAANVGCLRILSTLNCGQGLIHLTPANGTNDKLFDLFEVLIHLVL